MPFQITYQVSFLHTTDRKILQPDCTVQYCTQGTVLYSVHSV